MTFLTTDYKNNESNNNYGALPTGNYEMVIKDVTEKATPNGKEAMTVTLVVRNDLTRVPKLAETNGKYANRYVFNDNWKRNTPQGYAYDVNNLMYILEAAGVPEGTTFASFEDLASALRGRPVLVYVKEEEDDYNGGTRNNVAPWGYSRTEFPEIQHVWKSKDGEAQGNDPFPKNEAPVVQDSDLPF